MRKAMFLVLAVIFGFTLIDIAAGEKNTSTKTAPRAAGSGETIPPHKINWKAKAKAGSSSVTYYLDKDGVPTEVYVIGVANLPTGMRSVDAKEFASKRAELQAKSRFALWLQESVTVQVKEERKMLVVFSGGKELSETTTVQKSIITQEASNFWRGMSPFWYSIDVEKSMYICVWRWSVKESEIARLVEILAHGGNVNADEKQRKPYFKIESSEGFI